MILTKYVLSQMSEASNRLETICKMMTPGTPSTVSGDVGLSFSKLLQISLSKMICLGGLVLASGRDFVSAQKAALFSS